MGRGAGTEVVTTATRRRGSRPFWTDERIVEQLREVVAEIGDLPSMAELNRRGLSGMRKAIARKGMAFYAGRVGLPDAEVPAERPRPPAKERRTPRKWTDDRIEAELRRLAAENGGRFPKRIELEAQGLQGLASAIKRKGTRSWADHLDLDLSAGQDRSPYGISEARVDIERVVSETGRLPGERTLRKLGYGRLAKRIANGGGVARFCATHRIELPAA
jgi:hypothetical protein